MKQHTSEPNVRVNLERIDRTGPNGFDPLYQCEGRIIKPEVRYGERIRFVADEHDIKGFYGSLQGRTLPFEVEVATWRILE